MRLSHAAQHQIVLAAQNLVYVAVGALVFSGLMGGLPWWLPGEFAWSLAALAGVAVVALIEIRRDMALSRERRNRAEKTPEDPPPDEIADEPLCINMRCDTNLSRLARKLGDDACEQGRMTDAWFVHYQALERISELQRETPAGNE